MVNKTKICCLDVDKSIINYLKVEHEVYNGSLGKKVKLPKNSRNQVRVLPNFDFPTNFQEHDIFIIDLCEDIPIEYYQEDYVAEYNETGDDSKIICGNNVNLFNPIPFGAYAFKRRILNKNDKRPIIIVFQDEYIKREYRWGNRDGCLTGENEYSNYDFTYVPFVKNMYGTQMSLADNGVAEIIFKGWIKDLNTYCVFDCLGRENFTPLLLNNNGQCVSYIESTDKTILFMLPQMNNKAEFIEHLFNDVLYATLSEYFPYVEENRWIHKPQYMLPNEAMMVRELEQLEKEYAEKKDAVALRMAENAREYDFLHSMITETGNDLVKAVIKYLKWLGFENVLDKDETAEHDYEEDIQIDLGERGLLVIEVKGLYGTSKDSECSQIEKIKHRRERERKSFDVYALYLANHQRGVEPIKRQNPPFLPKQIADAEDDERGLATTWQLFNLYYDIEKGVIGKEDVREALLGCGLIHFVPQGVVNIGEPYKEYSGNVICIELDNQEVSVGDEMFAFDGQHWYKADVMSIREDKDDLVCVSKGRFGFRTSEQLPSKVDIYVRHKKG